MRQQSILTAHKDSYQTSRDCPRIKGLDTVQNKAPASGGDDDAGDEAIAADASREHDEKERKLNCALEWELFIYHHRVPRHNEKVCLHGLYSSSRINLYDR